MGVSVIDLLMSKDGFLKDCPQLQGCSEQKAGRDRCGLPRACLLAPARSPACWEELLGGEQRRSVAGSVLTCNRPPAREGQAPAVPARDASALAWKLLEGDTPWVREPSGRESSVEAALGPSAGRRGGQTGVAGASRALSRSHSRGESIVSESF